MELISLLLQPEILAVFGPAGTLLLAGLYTVFKMYKKERKKVDELQNEKFEVAEAFSEKYHQIITEVEKTLDRTLDHLKDK